MIHMSVGDKDLPHIHPVVPGALKLPQKSISSPAVHKQAAPFFLQHKAGVVALRYLSVSRSKHGDLHSVLFLLNSRALYRHYTSALLFQQSVFYISNKKYRTTYSVIGRIHYPVCFFIFQFSQRQRLYSQEKKLSATLISATYPTLPVI